MVVFRPYTEQGSTLAAGSGSSSNRGISIKTRVGKVEFRDSPALGDCRAARGLQHLFTELESFRQDHLLGRRRIMPVLSSREASSNQCGT